MGKSCGGKRLRGAGGGRLDGDRGEARRPEKKVDEAAADGGSESGRRSCRMGNSG